MKYSHILLMAMLLSACSLEKIPNMKNDQECFNTWNVSAGKVVPILCPELRKDRKFSKQDYELMIPGSLFRTDNSESEIMFDSNILYKKVPSDYYIKLQEFRASLSPCSPILTGALEVVELPMERGTATWGKVNYNVVYPLMDHAEGQPEPLCPPETPFTGSYAFCSEYEGKTVVVCIDQQTDNPAMAEEIFRTFRWLPEDQRSSSSSS